MNNSVKVELEELVDVIVITFNHENWIADCLNSILDQSHNNLKIHVIDDCSTDGTWPILEKYAQDHPSKISLCQTPMNRGVEQSGWIQKFRDCPVRRTGSYWAVIEGDDKWLDNRKLEEQINIFREEGPSVVAVSCDSLVEGPDGQEIEPIRPAMQRWNYMDYLLGAQLLYTHPSGILWRNCFPQMVGTISKSQARGGWPGGEWVRTISLLAESGGDMVNCAKPMTLYRFHGLGTWSKLTKDERETISRQEAQELLRLVSFHYRFSRFVYTAPWMPERATCILRALGLIASPTPLKVAK